MTGGVVLMKLDCYLNPDRDTHSSFESGTHRTVYYSSSHHASLVKLLENLHFDSAPRPHLTSIMHRNIIYTTSLFS